MINIKINLTKGTEIFYYPCKKHKTTMKHYSHLPDLRTRWSVSNGGTGRRLCTFVGKPVDLALLHEGSQPTEIFLHGYKCRRNSLALRVTKTGKDLNLYQRGNRINYSTNKTAR